MSAPTAAPPRRAPASGAPAPDPRIRARRVAVARARGRRRLAGLAAVLSALLVVTLALVAVHSPLFAARHVEITGAVHTPPAEVLAVTGLGRRPPLVDVNGGADAARLERLPWVASARVEQRWPDSVRVSIVERHAVAALPLPTGNFALADASGRILAEDVAPPPGAFVITGLRSLLPAGATLPTALRRLASLAGELPASLAPAVRAIEETGAGVELRLSAGPTALLGSDPRPRRQAVALETLLAKVPMTGIAAIDLRVPAAPVLTP